MDTKTRSKAALRLAKVRKKNPKYGRQDRRFQGAVDVMAMTPEELAYAEECRKQGITPRLGSGRRW